MANGVDKGYVNLKSVAPTNTSYKSDSASDSEGPEVRTRSQTAGRESVAVVGSNSVASVGRSNSRETEEPQANLFTAWAAGKFVIDPQANQFLPWWDGMLIMLIIVVSMQVPYEVSFHFGREEHCLWFNRINEIIFVMDMGLQFLVSSPDPVNHRWIRMPAFIVTFYIRTSLLSDVLSVLPYSAVLRSISKILGKDLRAFCAIKLLHLLKLCRVKRLTIRYATRVGVPYAVSKLARLLILLVLALHWLACCWGFLLSVQRFSQINVGATWADVLRDGKPGMFKDADVERPWELYTASLYWSCMTITSIGYGDISASNMVEAWGCILLMSACGLIWANIIGSICALASALDAENVMHENRLDSLNTMLHNFDIPFEVRMRLREYFMRSKVLYHRGQQVELLKCMSPELQGMVARFVQQSLMEKVWFLRDRDSLSDGFVVGLFERFQFSVYPPRELVRLRRSMVCMRTGVALLKARVLNAGSIWGIEDMVMSNRAFLQNYTPLALSYLELQYVTRKALKELTSRFPAEEKAIRKGAVFLAMRYALLQHRIEPSWVELENPVVKRQRSSMLKEGGSPAANVDRSVSFLGSEGSGGGSSEATEESADFPINEQLIQPPSLSCASSAPAALERSVTASTDDATLESKLKEALRIIAGNLSTKGSGSEGVESVLKKVNLLHELMLGEGFEGSIPLTSNLSFKGSDSIDERPRYTTASSSQNDGTASSPAEPRQSEPNSPNSRPLML